MNRVNQIFMGTKWPDDNSNIQGLGFEIAEVSIRTSVHLLVCIKEKLLRIFSRMLIVLKYTSVMFYSAIILRCLHFYCYTLYIMKYT